MSSALSVKRDEEDEELLALLVPELKDLPGTPPSAVELNFVRYYVVDFLKPGHDQYVYRHANGLCVIGLAPTHLALKEEGGVSSIDFNVGKSDRSEIKVTGKRKRNAQHFQSNTALCSVRANGVLYTVRCCVKGSLLEVNDRLIKNPNLLNLSPSFLSKCTVLQYMEYLILFSAKIPTIFTIRFITSGQMHPCRRCTSRNHPKSETALFLENGSSMLSTPDERAASSIPAYSIAGKGYGFHWEERILSRNPIPFHNKADREGYIAIMMPKPADWLKIKGSFLSFEDYRKLRGLH